MKCPIDKTEMESGSLLADGSGWIKEGIRSGLVRPIFDPFAVTAVAWHCPKCGKIELSTKINGKKTRNKN